MEIREVVINQERNVKLVCYTQKVGGEFFMPKRPAMIVLPGGGYTYLSEREAEPVAFQYLKAGFQAFVLYYTVGQEMKWPQPLEDYEAAADYIKAHAEEFAVDEEKICCIGFSAGGHLGAAASCLAKNRPAVAVLGYPAVKAFLPGLPNIVDFVDENTPPCFIFGTCDDDMVSPDNLVDFMAKLNQYDVTYESHIYGYGHHGSTTCDSSLEPLGSRITRRFGKWVEDSIAFIREVLGDFSADGFTAPVARKHINGNYDEYLNVDCTVGHLLKTEGGRAFLQPFLGAAGAGSPFGDPAYQEMVLKYRLRLVLSFTGMDAAKIAEIDSALRQIKNESVQ